MPSFGRKLKTEREKRGITLDQISSSTKIGTRMLQALEEENFDQLPGGIFNKGFVRAYARHMGLDEDQTVADYLHASGEAAPPQPDQKMEDAIAAPERDFAPPRQIPWGWLAGGLLVLALALWFWSYWQHKNEPLTAPAATSHKSAVVTPSVAASLSPAREVAPPKSVPSSGAIPVKVAAIQSATPAGEFTVMILASEDCWLSIASDGKAASEVTLIGEEQRAVHAQNEVVIRAGNVGALDFVFNGKKLPSQGDYGEVKTLTFNANGLQSKPLVRPTTP